MDNETKQKYIQTMIEYLYTEAEATKIVNDPQFNEEKFNSDNFHISMSNHKENIEKQFQQNVK